jgi:hypothetical protein
MDDELGGRSIIVWEESGDPYRNLDRLVNAITESEVDLYNQDGAVVWLTGGRLVPVNLAVLTEIVEQFVCTKSVRNVGTIDAPIYERRYVGFKVGDMTLRLLIQRGDLLARAPKISQTGTPNAPAELPRAARLEIANRRG